MRIRWRPGKQNFPAFHGRYIVDSSRGQLRIRKWPRKRGTPKSAKVRLQNAWFKNANMLAKHCAASQQVSAIEMTKGTGLYPRDLLLKCMSRGIIAPVTDDGRIIEYRRPRIDPVDFQGFMLRLTADQNVGVGAWGAPNWPLPVRDTAGFWNVAQPDRITIPPGVSMMILFTATLCPVVYNGNLIASIRDPAGVRSCRSEAGGNTNHGVMATSGPMPVTPGDWHRPEYYYTSDGRMVGDPQSYFGGIVLEAS